MNLPQWSNSRLVLGAVFILLLSIFAMPSPGRATSRLGESPHNQPGACAACHDPSAGPAPGAVRPIEANCRECHPDADMHPVGMRPKEIRVHEGWPLEDGVVTCATCHAEPSCDAKRERGAPFLREGTPERKMDFCYRCHDRMVLERSNPHTIPVEPATTNDQCAACHAGQPTKGAAPAEARLRLAPAEACATCHPGPVHTGAAEHLAGVQTAELATGTAPLLPLLDGGKIACWTCHDVHTAEKPVVRRSRSRLGDRLTATVAPAAGEGPEASETDNPMLALPAADGSLCRACHGTGPE